MVPSELISSSTPPALKWRLKKTLGASLSFPNFHCHTPWKEVVEGVLSESFLQALNTTKRSKTLVIDLKNFIEIRFNDYDK